MADMDAVYHLSCTVPHTSASLSLTFGAACEGVVDEGWGLDIAEVPGSP